MRFFTLSALLALLSVVSAATQCYAPAVKLVEPQSECLAGPFRGAIRRTPLICCCRAQADPCREATKGEQVKAVAVIETPAAVETIAKEETIEHGFNTNAALVAFALYLFAKKH